jgi:alpha-galactosidase
MQCRSILVAMVVLLAEAGLAAGISPTPYELSAARRWVAAKFENAPQHEVPIAGLHVLKTYGPVTCNAHADLPLKLGGKVYVRGFYCHANSKIAVRLPGPGKVFSASVGVNSNYMTIPGRGSIVCSVHAGGKEAFRSPVLREGMAPLPIRVDLNGSSEFTVEVGDAGDGISCDQSAWVDAQVALADGKTVWLGDLPVVEPRTGMYGTEPFFSFNYGGRPSAEFLKKWNRSQTSRKLDDCRTEHTVIFTEPQGSLVARCVAIEYRDFPTVEWTVALKNAGNADTPIIDSIEALDARLERGGAAEFTLHHHTGDNCTPDSYQPHTLELAPKSEHGFAPAGGRPTTGAFPYFNIAWRGEGVIAAVGWPGQWQARFLRDEGQGLRVVAGQELTRLRLHPGEEIRTPLVVLQFWSGDRIRAQNLWRRWMLAHNMPRPGGRLPPPMLSTCSGGFFPGLKCNEADELKFIDRYTSERIPLNYWWMDAGWYPCGDGWPKVGTWEVDRERFPRGLKAVSDFVHAKGIKLIVWFEPERVTSGSWLTEHHPEWVLGGKGGGLLNLGNTAARKWLTDHVDKLLTEQGIDLYRQDFNIDPLSFWRKNDAPDRQGITEIRHVEGYLAYWDELRRRHPTMLIDSCASGGRRNDLETLRRAVPLLRSDYQSFQGDPGYAPGNQCHTYGLASWIPYFGQGAYYNPDQLVYCMRSHFCPAFGMACDVRNRDVDWEQCRRLADDWRAMADDLLGDFYPLTAYTLDSTAWMAWQFHRPEAGRGMIQVFRRPESPYESARFKLAGLDPAARYALTNRDVPGSTVLTGRELMEPGLLVVVKSRPEATIITYKRVE